jgi:hypothetical protein
MVTGFPSGCYFYSWREDNTVLNLAGGGNWNDDKVTWLGGGPGPTPDNPDNPVNPQPGPANASEVHGYSGIDILPYLTKTHNGQPTTGYHSVEIYLPDAGSKCTMNAAVRTREHQQGRE